MILSIHRGIATAGLAVACLLAASCGGDDDTTDNGADDNSSDVERNEQREPLPVQEWWASVGGAGQQRIEMDTRVEGRIADCMSAQGFDYTPVEPHPAVAAATSGAGPWSLSQQEFAEQYGFGLFTLQGTPGIDDPNGAQVMSMSESERDNYSVALADEEGCIDQAFQAEFESGGVTEDLAVLEEEVISLEERVAENRDVQDAAQQWVTCMADADPAFEGVEDPNEAMELVVLKFEELLPEVAAFSEVESFPRSDGSMIHRMRGITLSTSDPQTVDELTAYELEVATSDYDCRAAYDNARYDVQFDLEEQFMEDNAELLDRVAESRGVTAEGT